LRNPPQVRHEIIFWKDRQFEHGLTDHFTFFCLLKA
jgi:hypothetical protein